ncbi:MAG: amidohydrolase family protein [Kiritimatiellae bacterium]|nr:amidohydrolase family protein [Kiritimatiellia bacterium]
MRRLQFVQVTVCLVLFACLFVAPDVPAQDESPEAVAFVDAHLHFCNQLERSGPGPGGAPGRRGPRFGRRPPRGGGFEAFEDSDFITCADNMIALMDEHGVEKAVVMPQPRLAGQKGYYDYTQMLPALRKYPNRLYLGAGGGILNSLIHSTDAARVTERLRARFRKEAQRMVKDGAKGFCELAALHVSLNAQHVYEEVAPDHPLFLLLADIAAEHGMPIDIHMEAVVEDTPCPANLRRISTHNPATLKANIPAFERLLAHNRKANIIWQHMGWDNVGQMTIELLRRMLAAHPNLYLGFKIEERPWQVGTREPMPNRMVGANMKLKPDWIAFLTDCADRLLVSSDQFVGIPGRTKRPPQYFELTWNAVKELPADVLRKVGSGNAVRLYHLE